MGYYISVEDNVKIYVHDVNQKGKKTILFVHGWPGNHKLFEYQFNQLSEFGYRCIGIDYRGFGNSDKPFNGYTYDQLADDLYNVIKALRLEDIILAGHSTGGAICIRYMARYNGYNVSKLALFAAAVPSLIQRDYFPYGLLKEDVTKIINDTYNDRPKMLKQFGDMIFYQYVTKEFSDWIFNLGLEASSWATIAIAKTWINDEELFNDLGKINVPTLILHSIYDKVCLFPLAIAQQKGIKRSKLVKFEKSGHFLFYDERDKFNEELIKFIEE
ncbi:MAG TPA: alpha/beta hydrolase [Tenericutes bacterium]|nr:alpha/beta hydrolase [Mycoplasmatota bacterium]